MTAAVRIPVGVTVERIKASSPWVDFIWRPAAVLPGVPETNPWTVLLESGDRTTFYAGPSVVELYVSETSSYRDNLSTGEPKLWVVLRPTESEPPFTVVCVTADGAEGEGYTAAGNDIVEALPMPDPVRDALEAFIAEHHVERPFFKRKRDRPNLDSLGRRGKVEDSG
jgi:hypothetical protein